jgi:hypothetical protein
MNTRYDLTAATEDHRSLTPVIALLRRYILGGISMRIKRHHRWCRSSDARLDPSPNRRAWLAQLAQLRQRLSTGKTSPTIEQVLDEDRGN